MLILGTTASTSQGSFYQIATSYASSAAVTDFTFSSIPQDYKHLQLRVFQSTTNASAVAMSVRINGISTATYDYERMWFDNTSNQGQRSTGITYGVGGTCTFSTTFFGYSVIDFNDYTNANIYRNWKTLFGYTNATNGEQGVYASTSRTAAAITSITLAPTSGNFRQYSHAALYGIK